MARSAIKATKAPAEPSFLQSVDLFFTNIVSILVSPTTQKLVFRSFAFSVVILSSIAAACLAYLSFYWRFIPNLALEHDVWLQYGYSRPPFARIDFQPGTVLMNQPYDIFLELQVPLSNANMDLGNFMAVLDLKTAQNDTAFLASRPSVIPHQSFALRHLPRPRSLLHLQDRGSRLSIELARAQVLEGRRSVSHVSRAYLEVGRHDAYNRDPHKELQVYTAKLKFHAVFGGLRYFMYNYRLTAFLTFTSLFLFSELCAALIVWAIFFYRHAPPAETKTEPKALDRKPTKEELRQQIETADKAEEEEFQRLQAMRFEKQAPGGRSMGSKGSVLGVLKDISSEEEDNASKSVESPMEKEATVGVEPKVEEESESEDPNWQNEATKDDDDLATLGGSSTSGEASTLRSFASKTTQSTASTDKSKDE